jgi:hypothetical protein
VQPNAEPSNCTLAVGPTKPFSQAFQYAKHWMIYSADGWTTSFPGSYLSQTAKSIASSQLVTGRYSRRKLLRRVASLLVLPLMCQQAC